MPLVTSGLQLHLDANDASSYSGSGTTWSDISGNGRNFTLTNGPVFTQNPKKIFFDGTNDYAIGNSFSLTNPLTICAWVYRRQNVAWASIIDRATGSLTSVALGFDNVSGNRLLYHFNSSGSYTTNIRTSNSTLDLNKWYYVCVTATTTSCTFYVNGVADGTFSVSAVADTGDYYLGANFAGADEYLRGDIGAVHVYNRVLSDAEILENYNSTVSTYVPTLTPLIPTDGLKLHLDSANSTSYPGTGTTWYDLSPGGKNATLYNGVGYLSTNKSMQFNGSQYAEVGSFADSFASFTTIVMFLPTSVTNYRNPIDANFRFYAATGNLGPRLEMNSSGALGWLYSNVTNNNDVWYNHPTLSSGLPANQWAFAALTYDGSINQSVSYFNGVATNTSRGQSGSPTGYLGTFNRFNIGRGFSTSGERYYVGYIRAVLAYNRVLSNEEINQVYQALSNSSPSPAVEVENFYVESLTNVANNTAAVEVENFYVESLVNVANNAAVEVENFYVEALGRIANNAAVGVENFYVEVLIPASPARLRRRYMPKIINYFAGRVITQPTYAVVSYNWDSGNGSDLDTGTGFVDNGINIDGSYVGYSLGSNVGSYLTWAGDNTNTIGPEEVVVNFAQLILDYPQVDIFKLRMGARWFGSPVNGLATLNVRLYNQPDLVFTDTGIAYTTTVDPYNILTSTKTVTQNGQFDATNNIAYLYYNKTTGNVTIEPA